MKLAMPDRDSRDSSEIEENKTLNIIVGADHRSYVYNGLQLNNLKSISGKATAIREASLQRKKRSEMITEMMQA